MPALFRIGVAPFRAIASTLIRIGLLTLLPTLVTGSCASVASPGGPATSTDPEPTADRDKDIAAGLKVIAGVITSSGRSAITCLVEQDGGTATVAVTLVPECSSPGPLRLAIDTGRKMPEQIDGGTAILGHAIPVSIQEGEEKTVSSFPIPLPEPGSLLYVRASATCPGVKPRGIWGTAHCMVPRP